MSLEKILSRSLTRGRLPSARGGGSGGISPVPSLKVPLIKTAHERQVEAENAAAIESGKRVAGTAPLDAAAGAAGGGATMGGVGGASSYTSSGARRADIAAFAGLSTPHFEPDSRAVIKERPERGGLRSLQDLPSLLESACALGEWQSALAALRDAFQLAHTGPSVSIKQVVTVRAVASVASVCRAQNHAPAFEAFMDSQSAAAAGAQARVDISELATEALVDSGAWVDALARFERLSADGRATVGSLNACIGGLAAGKQWEAALRLAAPAFDTRANAQLAAALTDETCAGGGGGPDGGSTVPLSHFGSADQPQAAASSSSSKQQQQQESSTTPALVEADAITYASLVSTLEACGRSKEAQQVLTSAPQSERDAVLASYVALLQIWGETHSKKSMKRF